MTREDRESDRTRAGHEPSLRARQHARVAGRVEVCRESGRGVASSSQLDAEIATREHARRLRKSAVPGLPAEFPEPVVVDAEMVRDLVDDGAADLVGDLLLGAARRADRLVVDGNAVGQHAGVL